jgi:hypothetical protein
MARFAQGSANEGEAATANRDQHDLVSADRATAVPGSGPPAGLLTVRTEILFALAIVAALAGNFVLAFRLNLNWDEFLFLTRVHEYLRGDLTGRFQTIYVHLFSWLVSFGWDEIDQIVAGRLVMGVCAAGSSLLLYGIARRHLSHGAALLGLVVLLSVSVIVAHGASFRADPLAIFLILLALFVALRCPASLPRLLLSGAVMALAAMVTLKTAFYLPVFAGIIWCVQRGVGRRIGLASAFGLIFCAVFLLLYFIHAETLAAAGERTAAGFLQRSITKVALEDGLFPRWREFLVVVVLNPLFWVMTVDGAVIAFRAARKSGGREYWLPLLLALPILTPLLYRNAFYYFYVFILPPAAVLIGLSYEKHRRRVHERPGGLVAGMFGIVIVAQLAFLAINYGRLLPDRTGPQRETIAAVHQIFPEPVAYIDGFGVVASFPRVGFFMSSWGMDSYRAAGRPVFRDAVAGAQPPMLLADSPSLDAAMFPDREAPEERLLLPADAEFLRENYIRHWGMIFVAGRTLMVPEQGDSAEFSIAVAGGYRLESEMPVTVDGSELIPGGVMFLAAGMHRIGGNANPSEVTLRWAAAKSPPDSEPVSLRQFFAFDR